MGDEGRTTLFSMVLSAGDVEYTDCISVEG